MAHPLLACCLCVCLAPVQSEERLARAEILLRDTQEGACKEGTSLCVEENSAAAAALLLDVLGLEAGRGLPPAHYRDVVWDGLLRLTDPYARARVEQELLRNKKSARVRQWCTELLGEYRDAAFGASVVKALGDKDVDVRRAAARAAGQLRLEAALEPLLAKVKDKQVLLRADAIEALARIDPAGQRATLLAGLRDADGGVRCDLLAVAAELFPEESEALALRALDDPDWRPRLQAVELLAVQKSPQALEGLIHALADARPLIVDHALGWLQARTGLLHAHREAWEEWWRANRDTYDPKGASKRVRSEDKTRASYNGVQVVSDHVAFLIDKSSGMSAELKSRSCSKDQAAREALEETMSSLQGKLEFSLFTYNRELAPFSKKGPQALTARSQEKALAFVAGERPQGPKDIWQALEAVLADPEIDTVYLLSSGEPDEGLYVHWNRVTWHLADLNRFRKLVVHTIAYSDSQWYRDQLEKISEVTGGEFRSFE